MADAMLLPALEKLQAMDKRYRAAHARATKSDTPKFKAWRDELAKKLETADVDTPGEPFEAITTAAQEAEDPVFVLALIEELDEVRETLKNFLYSHYSASTIGEEQGESLSQPELDQLYNETKLLFEKVLGMAEVGFATHDELKEFVPCKWTEPDKTSNRKPRFVWDHPGRVMEARGTQVRQNSTVFKIMVDGAIVGDDKKLGEAVMKYLGISMGTLKQEYEKTHGEGSFTDHPNYEGRAITVKDHSVELRLVKK